MQVHSHLLQNEIIGFVAGYRIPSDKSKRSTLIITETYPCESNSLDANLEERKDLERNVELSPESA